MSGSLVRLGLALSAALLIAATPGAPVLPRYPVVRADRLLVFPADHGAHPDYRTE